MLKLLVWGPSFKEQGYQWKGKTTLLTLINYFTGEEQAPGRACGCLRLCRTDMWDQTSLLSLHSKYLFHHLDALELLALLALFSGFRAIFSVLVVHWNHRGPLKNTDASPTPSQTRFIGSRVQPESGDF